MIEITEDYVTFEVAKLLKEKRFNTITEQAKSSYGDSRNNDIVYFTFYEESDKGEVTFKKCSTNSNWINGLFADYLGYKINKDALSYRWYLAPEHWQVIKWLKLVHNIYIYVIPYNDEEVNQVLYEIKVVNYNDDFNVNTDYTFYHLPEEATEAAIQYVLKHLL